MSESCARCQTVLAGGALRYRAHLRLWGDTGGELELPRDDVSTAMARTLRELERADPEECAAQVMEDLRFVLCPRCRDVIRRAPAGGGQPLVAQ